MVCVQALTTSRLGTHTLVNNELRRNFCYRCCVVVLRQLDGRWETRVFIIWHEALPNADLRSLAVRESTWYVIFDIRSLLCERFQLCGSFQRINLRYDEGDSQWVQIDVSAAERHLGQRQTHVSNTRLTASKQTLISGIMVPITHYLAPGVGLFTMARSSQVRRYIAWNCVWNLETVFQTWKLCSNTVCRF